MKKIVLALSAILSATTAMTTYAICSTPNGYYLDGDIGVTRAYGNTYPVGTTTNTGGKGWSIMAGYKFNPYVTVESGYTRYVDTRIQFDGENIAQNNQYAVDVTSKLILPVTNSGFEFFAKIGLGWIHAQIGDINTPVVVANDINLNTGTKTTIGLYWGGGAQYYFTNNLSAHLQYAQIQGNNNTGTLGVGTVGLSILIG